MEKTSLLIFILLEHQHNAQYFSSFFSAKRVTFSAQQKKTASNEQNSKKYEFMVNIVSGFNNKWLFSAMEQMGNWKFNLEFRFKALLSHIIHTLWV